MSIRSPFVAFCLAAFIAAGTSVVSRVSADSISTGFFGDLANAFAPGTPHAAREMANSQYSTAVRWHYGVGMPQDLVQATKWYRLAAENGHVDAQRVLGLQYEFGRGVAADPDEAAKWYLEAARNGDHAAQGNLLGLYTQGKGIGWIRIGAEGGDPYLQFQMGFFYRNGVGSGRDDAQALEWFRRGAIHGLPEAQNEFANMLENGQGRARDYSRAAQWYRKAAEQGNAMAQFNLGRMYHLPRGVPQDFAEAAKWFRMAADQGDAEAQINLATMYAMGEGIRRDLVQSYVWSTLGAAATNDSQMQFIAESSSRMVAEQMTPGQLAEAKRLVNEWRAERGELAFGTVPD